MSHVINSDSNATDVEGAVPYVPGHVSHAVDNDISAMEVAGTVSYLPGHKLGSMQGGDPTDPDSGGMSDASVPYAPYASSVGASTGYDPSYYQQQINDFFNSHKKGDGWTEYDTLYIMYMMQEYGGATTTVQANNVNAMNQYMDEIQQAWNILYSADNPAHSAQSSGLEKQFEDELKAIHLQMLQDPFFQTPEGKKMAESITSTLDGVESAVTSVTGCPPGMDKLFYMWAQYNPQTTGGTASQGQAGPMDNMMREMGQLNQQFTGASQIVQANTQVCAKTWQTEQDTMNNFMQQLNKLLAALTQEQRVN